MTDRTFYLHTFGCKSNQYESQAMRELLLADGWAEAARPDDAGLAVVNTCGVTGRAGASCRNAVRKIRRTNPDARLVVTGCAVDLDMSWPEDLPGPPPILVPNAKKHGLLAILNDGAAPERIEDDRLDLSISSFHGHTRAFLKIQDGCDNFCSYCAVPFARGKPASRPLNDILAEADRLIRHGGHREIVLTGINIGAYSHAGLDLADVATTLAHKAGGLERLRLGSVEPPYVTERLVDAIGKSGGRICPHVHVPMQAGDDEVLRLMGRRYTRQEFVEKTRLLQQALDRVSLTTDVIVGFPGETDQAAAAARELCETVGFSRLHVFLFSPRPGTKAATMKRTATDGEIEQRKNALIDLGNRLAERFAASCVGMEERVIVERGGTGLSDRYVKVRLPGAPTPGDALSVRITGSDGDTLTAQPLQE